MTKLCATNQWTVTEMYGAELRARTWYTDHGTEMVTLTMFGESGAHSISYPREPGAILNERGRAHWRGFLQGHLQAAQERLKHRTPDTPAWPLP